MQYIYKNTHIIAKFVAVVEKKNTIFAPYHN